MSKSCKRKENVEEGRMATKSMPTESDAKTRVIHQYNMMKQGERENTIKY